MSIMLELEFREAQPEDAEALLEYLKAVGAESDNLLFGAEGIGMCAEDEAAFLESALRSSKKFYLIALCGGEIAAQGSFACNEHRARVAHWGVLGLTVRRKYWNQGIGTALMQRLIEFARNTAKAEMIQLDVRSDNAPAIALYRKFGFVKTGTFPHMIKIGARYADCDTMVLHLFPSPEQAR